MTTYQSTASIAAQVVIDAAERMGLRVSVVILDATYTVSAAARMDGAQPSTYPAATGKAHAALNFGAETAAVKTRIVPENRLALQLVEPRLLLVGGGVPLFREGAAIGALGVSGGSEDQDSELARIGMELFA